jgi:multiple sugar transport system substrate-binding protein
VPLRVLEYEEHSAVKSSFFVMLVVLAGLSWVAWRSIPPPPGGGRTPLVWVVDDNPVRQAQVDLFNKLNPDIYLTIDPSDNELDKVIVQCSGGIGPDLINCQNPSDLDALVHAGIPLDVTDDLKAEHVDLGKLVWPIALSGSTYQGRVYGFPCNVYAMAIWFNKDLFDSAHVPYPKPGWSWRDLVATAQKLTIRDKEGRPRQFGFGLEWWAIDTFVRSFGGQRFSNDGTRCTLDAPGSIEGYSLAQDLMYKYRVAPTPGDEATLASQGGWLAGSLTYLMSGRVAMAFGARWWLNRLRQQKGLRLGVVEVPVGEGNPERAVGGASRCVLINRFSKHKQAALRFLRFLAERPYNDLINSQADGLAPVVRFCETDRFLHDPQHPDEDYNRLWLQIQKRAVETPFSPFLRGGDLDVITNQTDLIQNGLKPAPQALRDAAAAANALIQRNAASRPWLRDRYRELTGRDPVQP